MDQIITELLTNAFMKIESILSRFTYAAIVLYVAVNPSDGFAQTGWEYSQSCAPPAN